MNLPATLAAVRRARRGDASDEDAAVFVRAAFVGSMVGAAVAGAWLQRRRTSSAAHARPGAGPGSRPPDPA
jgi:hypothetical protein